MRCVHLDKNTAWIVSANMGLGHQRAVYPLMGLAYNGVHLLGEDLAGSGREQFLWNLLRSSYEFLSRTRSIPVIGPGLFSILDRVQNISPYYPLRDESRTSIQIGFIYTLIKLGFGQSLKTLFSTRKLPVITSFYASAIAAEELTDLPVYCIICDADISRAWVARNPSKSSIEYLVPCRQAMRRLKLYGVPQNRIHFTGFPLPDENIGGPEMRVLKKDLSARLTRLDSSNSFSVLHGREVEYYLGMRNPVISTMDSVTISYAVGGAGAQKEIAEKILSSLAAKILQGSIRINLVAGIRTEVRDFFRKILKKHGLEGADGANIVYSSNINKYFIAFSDMLHTTDILWSKPSEISFYCGLGIPLVVSPPIGPHEKGNKKWLLEIGAGIPQQQPEYCSEWLADYLADGRLAQCAWNGFVHAKKMGTDKIKEIVFSECLSPAQASAACR